MNIATRRLFCMPMHGETYLASRPGFLQQLQAAAATSIINHHLHWKPQHLLFTFIRAKKAVVSNASMWDTLNLLPKESIPKSYQDKINMTPQCESFMHLHIGFDAEVMWKAVERVLGPQFDREKCDVTLIGTPLTHQRFLRRTYGPAIQAGKDTSCTAYSNSWPVLLRRF